MKSITSLLLLVASISLVGCGSNETKTVTVKDGVETTVITRKVETEKKPSDYRYTITLMSANSHISDTACAYTFYADEIRFFNGYVGFIDSRSGKRIYGSNFIIVDNNK